MSINELAGALYTHYREKVGGKSVSGDKLPIWKDLLADPNRGDVVNAWVEVAQEALRLAPKFKGDKADKP